MATATRKAEIEAQVHGFLARLQKGEQTEDSMTEATAAWPTPDDKTARRLAGMANAARGEPVVWVIGVDEKAGTVVGAEAEELHNWFPQLESRFDGLAPPPELDLVVPVEATSVVALVFDTTRSPYVVRRPDSDQLEIPWREGTRTRSARRFELLQVLVGVVRRPKVEILSASLRV